MCRGVILSRFAPLRIALSPSVVILSEAKNLRAGSAKRLTVNSAKNRAWKRINYWRDPSSPSAPQDDTPWAFFSNLLDFDLKISSGPPMRGLSVWGGGCTPPGTHITCQLRMVFPGPLIVAND